MLKKYIRSTIIVTFKYLMPVLLLLLLAPVLLQFSQEMNQAQKFLSTHQSGFHILHGLIYIFIYYLWPRLIHARSKECELTPEQIQIALNAKWYLLAAMAVFELLTWWR
ncbi:hypothetical protein Lgee_0182 [Legionella geestiana]|uniref:Uncharacterized protein n=1 Tax=Legionella geestiana TaxID=45065 RepID=A0A0W0U9T9_9GAMM|nr:hypothetical protein [Legionella geestiana]KTD04429.1 hypothetical protein Lgee_0182 [Legionella geestiana]QBS12924.1 hypothetical protein E4T54_09310 [Legionella geestiana]QDQ39396.1 hypothetical protein E3226_002760 [Legionella geestiana]STX54581.1 Uncharacterised protein [Legionella geestiana]